MIIHKKDKLNSIFRPLLEPPCKATDGIMCCVLHKVFHSVVLFQDGLTLSIWSISLFINGKDCRISRIEGWQKVVRLGYVRKLESVL